MELPLPRNPIVHHVLQIVDILSHILNTFRLFWTLLLLYLTFPFDHGMVLPTNPWQAFVCGSGCQNVIFQVLYY